MRHAFERVRQGVSEIVHGVDTPGIARVVMRLITNPVQSGIPKVQVRRGHVYSGSKYPASFRECASAHLFE